MRIAGGLAVLGCGLAAAAADVDTAAVSGLIAGSLAAGILIDRSRGRVALICGLAVMAMALLRPVPGVLGLGAGMSLAAANTLVWQAAPGNRATALCLLNLPLPVGAILNPFVPTGALLPASAAAATLALLIALFARPIGPQPEAPPRAAAPRLPYVTLLLFVYAVCETAIWRLLPEFWRVAHVLDISTARLIAACGVPLGMMAGRAAAARLAAAIPPLTLLRFTAFAMTFATALMLLARSPSASCVAAFLVGLALAPVLPMALAEAGWSPLGMAAALSAGWLGLAAASPLLWWIAHRSTLPTAMLLLPVASLAIGQLAVLARPVSADPRERAD